MMDEGPGRLAGGGTDGRSRGEAENPGYKGWAVFSPIRETGPDVEVTYC